MGEAWARRGRGVGEAWARCTCAINSLRHCARSGDGLGSDGQPLGRAVGRAVGDAEYRSAARRASIAGNGSSDNGEGLEEGNGSSGNGEGRSRSGERNASCMRAAHLARKCLSSAWSPCACACAYACACT